MKQLKIVFAFSILINLLACEPPVTFSEPQPADTNNLSKFPKRLQGKYVSLIDTSTLIITEKLIERVWDFYSKNHLNEIIGEKKLNEDSLIFSLTKSGTLVGRDGDSLLLHIYMRDTLFAMNSDNVVRKFKGYYFISTRYDEAKWEVKQIQLSKGKLVISSISPDFELETLQEITESPKDTVPPYTFTPSKKQFGQFIIKRGFSTKEFFVRQ